MTVTIHTGHRMAEVELRRDPRDGQFIWAKRLRDVGYSDAGFSQLKWITTKNGDFAKFIPARLQERIVHKEDLK